jgi:alkyldihydroxyacetonephosphate synthase
MNSRVVEILQSRLGDRVRTDPDTIRQHLHDQWVISILRALQGRAPAPLCVVYPRTTAEVSFVLEVADREKVPVVPRGGGSGVCGGAVGPSGAVVASLRGMDRIVELETRGMTVRVQPGVLGQHLEGWLRERGFTLGHFPQSVEISSVGGWISTRASGQLSTKYGSIEDMLLAFEAVLPGGRVVRTRAVPRSSTGPDLRGLVLGAEGTLAILTEATLRLHRVPEREGRASWSFPDFHAGLEAIREILQSGWRPAVVRLYDEVETARHFSGQAPEGRSLLLVHAEGPERLVEAELDSASTAARRAGASFHGPSPVDRWFEHRNRVPSFESFLERGIVVDTLEVAAGWDRVHGLYDRVLEALRRIPDLLVASAHCSHSYLQGTSLYFTFALQPPSLDRAEELYFRCRDAALEATLSAGGTISHHHGIGRQRVAWLRHELGQAYELLLALKRALDPNGILNPGALLGD